MALLQYALRTVVGKLRKGDQESKMIQTKFPFINVANFERFFIFFFHFGTLCFSSCMVSGVLPHPVFVSPLTRWGLLQPELLVAATHTNKKITEIL